MRRLSGPARIVFLAAAVAVAGCAQKAPSRSADQPSAPPSAVQASTASTPTPTAADFVSGDILDEIALTRAGVQARRQAIVTSAMDLTAPESEAFWPLYRDYRMDMAKVDDRLVDLIIVYAGNYDSLSDELASKLLTDYLDIERARLDVKGRYVPRFQGVLPARKVARFYQVDNKLDKKIQAELAREIPLTR